MNDPRCCGGAYCSDIQLVNGLWVGNLHHPCRLKLLIYKSLWNTRNMEKRKFKEGEANHVYQRTISGFNIFYDVEDYIVYYTIFSVLAVRYDIIVYGLCLMIDHVHSLFTSHSASTMSRFISHVTSLFVKEYNVSQCFSVYFSVEAYFVSECLYNFGGTCTAFTHYLTGNFIAVAYGCPQ